MVNYANVRVPKEDKKDALLSRFTPGDASRLKPHENNDTGDLALFWFAAFKHCSKLVTKCVTISQFLLAILCLFFFLPIWQFSTFFTLTLLIDNL